METSADLVKRDITPFLMPSSEIWLSFFSNSLDPNYQEISQRFVIAKDWDEYEDMVRKVISTGLYASMGTDPWCFDYSDCTEQYKDWYKSSERIAGKYPYTVHLPNKKWPLKKVFN